MAARVCEICFQTNPKDVQLLSLKCFLFEAHKQSRKVAVQYSSAQRRLVEVDTIRPLPKLKLEPNKRFVLCKNAGSCSRGDNCTFAHNRAEQEDWNNQLLTQSESSKIGSSIRIPSEQKEFNLQHSDEDEWPTLSKSATMPSRTQQPQTTRFLWAQAAKPKKVASAVRNQRNLKPPQHFPPLQSRNVTVPKASTSPQDPHPIGKPMSNGSGQTASGFRQRSTSGGQVKSIPQKQEVPSTQPILSKGRHRPKPQNRSLSESSADQLPARQEASLFVQTHSNGAQSHSQRTIPLRQDKASWYAGPVPNASLTSLASDREHTSQLEHEKQANCARSQQNQPIVQALDMSSRSPPHYDVGYNSQHTMPHYRALPPLASVVLPHNRLQLRSSHAHRVNPQAASFVQSPYHHPNMPPQPYTIRSRNLSYPMASQAVPMAQTSNNASVLISPSALTGHGAHQGRSLTGWPSLSPPSSPPVWRHPQPHPQQHPNQPTSAVHSMQPSLPNRRIMPPQPAQSQPQFSNRPDMSSAAGTGAGSQEDVACAPLSRDNYKEKYQRLLAYEEKEHKRLLDEKCNGEYTLVLYQTGAKPPALSRRNSDQARYRRYGYLQDISGDQVAYATQASQGTITISSLDKYICKAAILRDNYNHTDERLYIAFEISEDQKLQGGFLQARTRGHVHFRVSVKFELKYSYFRNLKTCVDRILPPLIKKILPKPSSFRQAPCKILINLGKYERICSTDQLDALRAILTCSPQGPPNVIAGPFGTGKTRTLAIAASCFFAEAQIKRQPARILVCTHQRKSADNFYEHYQNLMENKEHDLEIIILRDYSYKHPEVEIKNVYKTIQEFLSYRMFLNAQQNHLIISTCLMVRELVRDLGNQFFTHILIDEGAQMREPEAIAPLSLADPDNTKIVIAGDQHQVGPAMLVFGDVPIKYGLATSLLERLFSAYKKHRQEDYISTLVTNYRSHPDIAELPSALFYETPLIAPKDRDPPQLHPSYPYPLCFICSSVDQAICQVDANINQVEASTLLDEVSKFARNWPIALWGPVDLSQTCLMSPCRPQLTAANKLIYEKRLSSRLKAMRRLPTYDMQGREFRALFLSTSEPTNSDASSRNPSKSLCDRYVFNTAITRAQSLVVASGNPFLLLKTEETMLTRYGKKGKVWSNYLRRCLEHKSLIFPASLKLTRDQADSLTTKLSELVTEQVEDLQREALSQDSVDASSEDFPPLVSQHIPRRPPVEVVQSLTGPAPAVTIQPQNPSQQAPQQDNSHSYMHHLTTSSTQQAPQLDNSHSYMHHLTTSSPAVAASTVVSNISSSPSQLHYGTQGQWSDLSSIFNLPLEAQTPQDAQILFPALYVHELEHTALDQQSDPSLHQSTNTQPRERTSPSISRQQNATLSSPVSAHIDTVNSFAESGQHSEDQYLNSASPVHGASLRPSRGMQPPLATLQTDQHPGLEHYFQTDQLSQVDTVAQVKSNPLHSQEPSVRHTGSAIVDHQQPQLANNIPVCQHQSPLPLPQEDTFHPNINPENVQLGNLNVASNLTGHGESDQAEGLAWSGGEMRVSPEPSESVPVDSTQQHQLPEVHSSPFFQAIISDDTHRKTPSPNLPGHEVSNSDSSKREDNTIAVVAAPSRLEKDFEVKEEIGKGGFGVVFHVKSRMDQCDYALKIIRLSDNPKEQKKVMREVRALAHLDHQHIVRYHTSWKEKAPDGWTEKKLWSILKSSESLPSVQVPVRTAGDSSPHTTPSSADTPTTTTEQSGGAIEAPPSTDSVAVTFRANAGSLTVLSQSDGRRDISEMQSNELCIESEVRPHPLSCLPPPTCLFIQTELCQRDTLRTWLSEHREERSRTKKEVLCYFQQILDALVYIHEEKFVHRDLKPSNIFFSRREGRLKIGDFGLVTTGVAKHHGGVDATLYGSLDSHSRGSIQAGTFLYMSPEQIKGSGCNDKSDMFALGVIFFELHYPMKTGQQRCEVLTALRSSPRFPAKFGERLHDAVASIVALLLDENPSKRPSARELKEHKLLQGLEKKVRKSKSEYIPVL